ncbi:MAG TPA: aldolase/citrate lyase family protein [Phycisphaerae bacterium]|nr:aldolase/citrate lyase family protein [Phycisphaerae bacterium]
MVNALRASLEAGPQLGLCVMYPAPGIIERIGPDWDWLWIDGQHGELGYDEILACVRAGDLVRRPAVVRVPGHDSGQIGKALDTATAGIMVPMVDSAEQARRIVEAAKFPPLGKRSYGGRRPVDLHGRGYANRDRRQPVLVCQIETPEGLANVEAIAAVDGVDVLFFGPDDMALRAGMPMDVPRPEGCFDEAQRKVAQAARANGKLAGGVFVAPEALRFAIEAGYRLIVAAGDVFFLADGSSKASSALRNVREELGFKPAAGQDRLY